MNEIRQKFVNNGNNTEKNCQLLAFLYLNEGLTLILNNSIEESVIVFNSAFKFSMENIGELHPITAKIKSKINATDRRKIQDNISSHKTENKTHQYKNKASEFTNLKSFEKNTNAGFYHII